MQTGSLNDFFVGRYGGDEFIIIANNTSKVEIQMYENKIKKNGVRCDG